MRKKGEFQTIKHTFEPVFDENSRILILGSLPSAASRQNRFYYGHPQNRFWKVLADITQSPVPLSVEEKTRLLLENRIALWDVVFQCDIIGSSDSSIRNVVPNDLGRVLSRAPIEKIFANGGRAFELYTRFCEESCKRSVVRLPSTSPSNAAWSLQRLTEEWKKQLGGFC